MATLIEGGETARPATHGAELPLSTCVGWGIGSLAVGVLFNSVNVLLLRYMVDQVGIAASVAGALIGLSKIYDAFIDPLVGVASDKTRTHMGRRRPFILGGGLLLALSGLWLFNVPARFSVSAATIYVAIGLIVYATAYAAFSVPYMAMPAEMTPSPAERSRLISFRVYAVAFASLIATFVGPVLIAQAGGGQAGHTAMSVFIAVVAVLGTLLCFRGTRNAPFHGEGTPPRMGFARKLTLIAGNRPFMLLLVIKLLQLTALAVTQAATPFLFKRVIGLSDTMLGLYFLVFYGTMILAQRLWLIGAQRLGKRTVYLWASAAYGLMYLSWYFVTPGEPIALVYLRAVVLGATAGAVLLFGQSLLPDTMEWDYRRTGLRREGLLAGLYTVIEKLSYALGASITGLVLGGAGYVQATGDAPVVQPQSAIEAIYLLASIFPMVLLLASCIALVFYNLSESELGEPVPDHDQ